MHDLRKKLENAINIDETGIDTEHAAKIVFVTFELRQIKTCLYNWWLQCCGEILKETKSKQSLYPKAKKEGLSVKNKSSKKRTFSHYCKAVNIYGIKFE